MHTQRCNNARCGALGRPRSTWMRPRRSSAGTRGVRAPGDAAGRRGRALTQRNASPRPGPLHPPPLTGGRDHAAARRGARVTAGGRARKGVRSRCSVPCSALPHSRFRPGSDVVGPPPRRRLPWEVPDGPDAPGDRRGGEGEGARKGGKRLCPQARRHSATTSVRQCGGRLCPGGRMRSPRARPCPLPRNARGSAHMCTYLWMNGCA